MGVTWTTYVIVGIKTKFNEIEKLFNIFGENDDLKLDGVVDQWHDHEAGNFVYITDGMNGKYDILGKIITMSEEYSGIDVTDCLEKFEQYKAEVSEKLRALGISIGKVSVYAFTHYS